MSSLPGTVIVTGAAGGLGFAIAEQMLGLSTPYTGIFTVRNTEADNAKPLLQKISAHRDSSRFSAPSLDLSKFDQVRDFAHSINQLVKSGKLRPIRALVLNAAFQAADKQYFNNDGYEMNMAVNHLANVLLVNLLLPSIDKTNGRIVYISSWSHNADDPMNKQFEPSNPMWQDPNDLVKPPADDPELNPWIAGMRRYASSKLAFQAYALALQKKIEAVPSVQNIAVVSIDPGAMVMTNLNRSYTWAFWAIVKLCGIILAPYLYFFESNGRFRTTTKSAKDACRCAFAENDPVLGEKPKGVYMYGSERAEAGKEARNEDNQRIVWEQSMDLVGLKKGESVLA